jgi:hypothetical protein
MWSAAVWAPALPGAQDAGQRLATLVQIADQGVEAEAALEVARRSFLLGVGGDQRGVEVERDPLRRCPLRPGSLARLPAPIAQDAQPLGRDRIDDPPGRRRRRHLAEKLGLPAQHAQVGLAVAAVRDAHDQIAQHPAWIMGRTSAPGRRPPRRQRRRPPQPVGEFGKGGTPRMASDSGAIGGDDECATAAGRLHLGGALLGWVLGRLTTPVSNSGESFFYPSSRLSACLTGISRLAGPASYFAGMSKHFRIGARSADETVRHYRSAP